MGQGGSLPVGPGFLGFVTIFLLAVVVWFLLRNMSGRLRRMAYREREAQEQETARRGDIRTGDTRSDDTRSGDIGAGDPRVGDERDTDGALPPRD